MLRSCKLSRTTNHARNAAWEYLSSFLLILFGLVSRTVFIKVLSAKTLGLNTLFLSIVGVLSVLELGIGPILNTQLYKPVAENDYAKVSAIFSLYKRIYRIVCAGMIIIGILLIPVLQSLVKDTENVSMFWLYYAIVLITYALNYLTLYKFSISNAEQKAYLQINTETVFQLATHLVQIIALITLRSFLTFLLIHLAFVIMKNIIVSMQFRNRYKFVVENRYERIDTETMKGIKRNLMAGGINKLTDVAINQTDSIIISSVVGIETLGIASNYLTLRTYIERFTKPLIDNMGPIVGNYVSVESAERKQMLMRVLQFVSFWVYGFCSIAFLCLTTPFVRLWLGKEFTIMQSVLLVLSLNFMLSGVGDRPYCLFKNSHGVFYDDWHLVLTSALINLTVSIILARIYGLVGVFLGMTASIVFSVFIRPIVFYSKNTGESLIKYYSRVIRYFLLVVIVAVPCFLITNNILNDKISILRFALSTLVITVIPNVVWVALFAKTREFKYVVDALKRVMIKRRSR